MSVQETVDLLRDLAVEICEPTDDEPFWFFAFKDGFVAEVSSSDGTYSFARGGNFYYVTPLEFCRMLTSSPN